MLLGIPDTFPPGVSSSSPSGGPSSTEVSTIASGTADLSKTSTGPTTSASISLAGLKESSTGDSTGQRIAWGIIGSAFFVSLVGGLYVVAAKTRWCQRTLRSLRRWRHGKAKSGEKDFESDGFVVLGMGANCDEIMDVYDPQRHDQDWMGSTPSPIFVDGGEASGTLTPLHRREDSSTPLMTRHTAYNGLSMPLDLGNRSSQTIPMASVSRLSLPSQLYVSETLIERSIVVPLRADTDTEPLGCRRVFSGSGVV